MDLTLPLYRQLSGRLLLLLLCFILSAATGISAYFYQTQQLATFNSQQLPEIHQYNQRQQLLLNHERLINTMAASETAERFSTSYRTLTDNLKQLSTLSKKNYRLFDSLLMRLQLQAENVSVLAESHRGNMQLKESVIIQLTLVRDSLSTLISNQLKQQAVLYQQASSGNITAKRALTLSNLALNLNSNRELHRLLVDSLVMFNHLDLQYDLIEFNYLQHKNQSDLQHWLLTMSNATKKSSAEKTLEAQGIVLNDLFFFEQNTFIKWREQLHRANDFRVELLAQKIELAALLTEPLPHVELQTKKLPQQLQRWLLKANITLAEADYIWFVVAIFSALTLVSLMVIFSIRMKLKHLGQQSTAIVVEYVEKGTLPSNSPTEEITDVLAAIKQLSRPKHSEVDYLHLKQEQQLDRLMMSEHSAHVFWQLPELAKNQPLISLLAFDSTVKHWRCLFSRNDVRKILIAARMAKKEKIIQRLSLITAQEKAILLTIEYRNSRWFGCVCSTEELHRLQHENSQLLQEMQQQNQSEKLNIIASSEYVVSMVQNSLLQRQLSSVEKAGQELAEDIYLEGIIKWCQQQKTSAQLRRDDFLLTLSTVNIINELDTVIANIALQESKNNNAFYVNVDDTLKPFVSLDSGLFQAMIWEISSLLLANQEQATLDISLHVKATSSTQQTVCCSFLLSDFSKPGELAQSINGLVEDTDASDEGQPVSFGYLRDLMLIFNVSNKGSQQLEKTINFSFDIALVLAEQANVESINTNFATKTGQLSSRNILVIATDKSNRQRICQALSDTQANVETMQDLTLFQRQLNLEHLTKNRLDAIIIAPEVYCSDYALIVRHIATLPEQLSPKMLVVQPFNDPNIAKGGMFEHCITPWYERTLPSKLMQLMSEESSNNLLTDHRHFSQQSFLPTQVKLLLAVAQPSAHQSLVQLLHWLGLRITLVSQQQSLDQYWQTGQYLVVISEFTLLSAKPINSIDCLRGVFSLATSVEGSDDIFVSVALPESWQQGNISTAMDIPSIIKLLSPWLTPAEVLLNSVEVEQNLVSANVESIEPLPAEKFIVANKKLVTEGFQSSEDFEGSVSQDTKTAILFDLIQYAKNQGSVELAALMLDEYLMDIEQALLLLEKQVNENNQTLALFSIMRVLQLADVIAAKPLSVQCLKLKEILTNENTINALSLRQDEHLQQQLIQVKLCHTQLSAFAESI
jgi:hypothetical protein